jgi:hypothetical protein
VKHLWEAKHLYYCNEGNYFARESVGSHYKSLVDFLSEEAESDMDYNLVFRWDWDEEDGDEQSTYNGDDYYRNGVLKVFFMGQRKGLYRYSTVEVCRADEPAVIEYLRPRLGHLLSLWEPLSAPAASGEE